MSSLSVAWLMDTPFTVAASLGMVKAARTRPAATTRRRAMRRFTRRACYRWSTTAAIWGRRLGPSGQVGGHRPDRAPVHREGLEREGPGRLEEGAQVSV